MKIAILNDSHFGVRQDSPIFQNIILQFLADVFFPYIDKHNITHVFHLGDLVDRRKYININTMNVLVDNFLEKFNPSTGRTLTALLGNHDVSRRDTNAINSLRPLVHRNPSIQLIERPQTIVLDGCEVALCPWITEDNEKDTIDLIETTTAQICFGHFELAGFEMMPGVKIDHGHDRKMLRKFSKVLSGHYHHKSDDGQIFYLGTQYQLDWGDYGSRRGFHVFDTDTHELTFIENPTRNFEKLNYNDEKNDYADMNVAAFKDKFIKVIVEKRVDEMGFRSLIEKIENLGVHELTVIEAEQTVTTDESKVDISQDTFSIIKQYVESSDQEDKEVLVKIFHSVYTEALHPSE